MAAILDVTRGKYHNRLGKSLSIHSSSRGLNVWYLKLHLKVKQVQVQALIHFGPQGHDCNGYRFRSSRGQTKLISNRISLKCKEIKCFKKRITLV